MTRVPFLVFITTLVACRAIPNTPPRTAQIERVDSGSIETRTDVRTEEATSPDDEDVIRACGQDDVGAVETEAAIRAFDSQVASLGVDDDPAALTDVLKGLMTAPCLELAEGDFGLEEVVFDSGLALKNWWSEGGSQWLNHYVTLGKEHYSYAVPTPRKTLTSSRTSHPLSPILCPGSAMIDATATCGRETRGWARRMEKSLVREANARRDKSEQDCGELAKAAPKIDRYDTFRTCIEDMSPRHDALPIGRFKAPADGWLVMTQNAGTACPTVIAYDLAMGSAYTTSHCRGTTTTTTGRVSTSALREATWALMLSDVVDTNVRIEIASYQLPPEVEPMRKKGSGIGMGLGECGSSASSIRQWSWMRGKSGALSGQASGKIDMYACGGDTAKYVVELIEAMEEALEPGCVPSSPPRSIAWEHPGEAASSAMKIDSLAAGPSGDAFLKAKPPATCAMRP